MIQKTIVRSLFIFFFLWLPYRLSAQASTTIEGRWQDAKHPEKVVQMVQQNGLFSGKSISNDPSENGKIIFRNLIWNRETKTYDGDIIDPENGKAYSVSIEMRNANNFYFKVGVLFFSKSFHFKRF